MKLYRLLLHLYPVRFREEYARQMEIGFADDYRHAAGFGPRASFWFRSLTDLFVSIPAELGRELGRDLLYATRIYRQRKFVTSLAVGALAVAMGATTGIFSVVNAVLLRELPFRDADRVVEIVHAPLASLSTAAQFRNNLDQAREYLDDAAVYTTSRLNVERNGIGTRVRVTETSANFFALLGIRALLGRSFQSDENQAAMISHRMWQETFGGDASALGSTIAVNGVPFTVIGIAPAAMDFPIKTDVWTSTGLDVQRIPKTAYSGDAIGRLKMGLSLAQARAAFETVIRRGDPKAFETYDQSKPRLTPLRDTMTSDIREASLILFATVAFVLLIACANVAQLLLARFTERRHELAVRAALGASIARIAQQLITEALAMTMLAVAAGMAVAYWAAQTVSQFQPAASAAQTYTILDVRVLTFAVLLALLCGLFFGVVPAAFLRRLQSSPGQTRVRSGLMALQAALTVILLAGSVSLGRSFLKLVDTNLGFDTSQVLTMQVSLEASRHAGSSGFYDDVVQRVRAIPGVEAAGTTLYLPLEPYPNIPGAAITLENDQQYRMRENAVGSGYFAAMHQEFVAGRDFNDAERHGSENAVIVNEEVARSLGLGAKIVGQHLKGKQPATVVGVVRTARWEGPIYGPWGEWFVPLERRKPNFAAFAIRIRGDASSYIPSIRGAVQAVDPAVPIFRVEPMKTFLDERLARPRFYTTAMTFLGGFALLLAAIGIYGVASNSVTQRTREMGVRLAVGASATGVRAMLLRQAMLPLLAGLAMGITGAITLSAYLQHWMTSAEPVGLGATAAAAGTLIVCCASAVWRATARVVSIDPMQALRAD